MIKTEGNRERKALIKTERNRNMSMNETERNRERNSMIKTG